MSSITHPQELTARLGASTLYHARLHSTMLAKKRRPRRHYQVSRPRRFGKEGSVFFLFSGGKKDGLLLAAPPLDA